MSTVVQQGATAAAVAPRAAAGRDRAMRVLAIAGALGGVVLGAIGAVRLTGAAWVGVAVVCAWAAAAIVTVLGDPTSRLARVLGGATVVGGAAVALWPESADIAPVPAVAVAAIPAVLLHLALALPRGVLGSTPRRVAVALGYAGAVATGLVMATGTRVLGAPLAIQACVYAAAGIGGCVYRCRRAPAVDRARVQWVGWGVVVTVAAGLLTWALHALTDFPERPALVTLAVSIAIPLGFALSCWDRALARVDRIVVHTIVAAGLVALVTVVYLVIVVGGHGLPNDDERGVVALAIVAAAVAAVLAFPARSRLEVWANERVYGERHAPDESLRTFASRMSRAVPMDELLLQLVESLRKTMALDAAEIWTGSEGRVERTVSVPDRDVARLVLNGEELTVAARAHVSGPAWLAVWVPGILAGREGAVLRVASIAHLGELLGFIVAERGPDGTAFTEEEDRVMAELARQVGLALHNVRLDSALQASLEELQVRNEELAASRSRIVAAADESRRQIERNLHDGAQQHLVAIAVKLGLARQLMQSDAGATSTMLEELRGDVQAALTELRELAHGIYPPLLRERGLREGLQTAANRAVLPTTVEAESVGRHPTEVEVAVYFCCLEAIQNAGKHAGEGASILVKVSEDADTLRFSVADTGAGFVTADASYGHGFVNMRDRLGAIGGELRVQSAPGEGTTVTGTIPLAEAPAA